MKTWLVTGIMLIIVCETGTGIYFSCIFFVFFLLLVYHISFCILCYNTVDIKWVGLGLCLFAITVF